LEVEGVQEGEGCGGLEEEFDFAEGDAEELEGGGFSKPMRS
jgi:hypothetical protein